VVKYTIAEQLQEVSTGNLVAWRWERNSCHIDTWLMLMASAVTAYDGRTSYALENDTGTNPQSIGCLSPNVGYLFHVLSQLGEEKQDSIRTEYWKHRMEPLIAYGEGGGIWDHVRAYAEFNWPRGATSRAERLKVYSPREEKAFDALIDRYEQDLVSTLVATTMCPECGAAGRHLTVTSMCHVHAVNTGTFREAIVTGFENMVANPRTPCGRCGARGTKELDCSPASRTRMARLLVVHLIGDAAHVAPRRRLDFGVDGVYDFAGAGHYGGDHWECTYRLAENWFHYNDHPFPHISRVRGEDHQVVGKSRSVLVYTKGEY
jgi:hypothetical protein